MNVTPIEILYVEDDSGDIELTRKSLQQSKLRLKLNVVNDGMKALSYLRREGPFRDAKKPHLILLDLNLPKKNGQEVLEELKNDAGLNNIPVVVWTTSDADEDILQSYKLGCNCYMTKPVGLVQFSKVIRAIEEFWFTIVKLPPI